MNKPNRLYILGFVKSYNTDDIIYSLATGWVQSAIAVVRVSGNGCIRVFENTFKSSKKLSDYSSNTAVFGHILSDKGTVVDECIVTVFRDGHGYTGEESFEISCHGGLQTIKAVLSRMGELGFRQAERGEFTLRAFMHSKMDLTRAEAINELINSKSSVGMNQALNRLSGTLYKRIDEIKNIILDIMSTVEVQLDYSEDEIGEDLTFPFDKLDKALKMLDTVSLSYNTGRLYSQGAKVVLAGPANAGKSSLFNMFLKEERAIVSEIKGTTRDYIEAECNIAGIPIRLYDTAGLRESSDKLEEEGIKRSYSLLETADLIVYMTDASEPEIDDCIVDDKCCIKVVNKIDIRESKTEGFIAMSVKTGEGFDRLCKEIERRLTENLQTGSDDGLVIENMRQRDDLQRAKSSLSSAREHFNLGLPLDIVTMDIQEALEALGEITGEVTTDDVMDKIFSTFCVGK